MRWASAPRRWRILVTMKCTKPLRDSHEGFPSPEGKPQWLSGGSRLIVAIVTRQQDNRAASRLDTRVLVCRTGCAAGKSIVVSL